MNQAAANLSRPGAGPLERLLAERAALAEAWLADLRHLEQQAAIDKADLIVVRGFTRRMERAERELAAAERILRAFQERLPPGP